MEPRNTASHDSPQRSRSAANPDVPRLSGRPAARTERVLAVSRAFLTITGLIAIYLDPTEPARLREITYGVLLGYALYSLVVLAYVHLTPRLTRDHGLLLHGLDIFWTSALTFVSEGPVSPFFLFFLFVVLSAAHRWGFRGTTGTALITVLVFLTETSIAAFGSLGSLWSASIDFELNRTILRVEYLLLTGVLLGYLAEQQKQSRAELATIAQAAKQPHVNLGLNGSISAFARTLRTTFRARAVAIVVRDHETRRASLWQLEELSRPGPPPAPVRRSQLTPDEQAVWLFDDYGRTWSAVPDRSNGGSAYVRVAEPDRWALSRRRALLPPSFFEARDFDEVMAVNMGLQSEWQGRVYVFDPATRGGHERRLHFLEELAEHVTPALTNVLLLRRLRARAGAVERARVARDLHDGAIQALYGIDMKIEAVRRESRHAPAAIDVELLEIQRLLRCEVIALRELMQALRPTDLDSSEQAHDVIATLVERFRRDTGIAARFVTARTRISLSPSRALELVRIVQETLVNVRKHSQARNVLVRLTGDQGICTLAVEDDGVGFPFEGRLTTDDLDARRVGPAIIKERARIANFSLAVDSMPGAGTRIELVFAEDGHA